MDSVPVTDTTSISEVAVSSPPPARQTLSVVIGVKDEEKRIVRCLEAVKWADEIVIVDMFSSDQTEALCRAYPNVVFYQNQDYFNANVNFGIERASGDWIMRLDADEIVSPELKQEILEDVLANPNVAYSGFWIPSRTFFWGKWIRYGLTYDTRFGTDRPGYAYRKMLFRRGAARYECQREHEDISVTGEWGVLRGHYDHFSHRTLSQSIDKMQYYTDRDVERLDVLAPDYRVPTPLRTLVALILVFCHHYLRRKGYKDGRYGVMTCAWAALYVFVERMKIWEKHYRLTHPDDITPY